MSHIAGPLGATAGFAQQRFLQRFLAAEAISQRPISKGAA
jgi:hypothetical protein